MSKSASSLSEFAQQRTESTRFTTTGLTESVLVGRLSGADEAYVRVGGETFVVHQAAVSDPLLRQNIINALLAIHTSQREGTINWVQIGIGKGVVSVEIR